MILSADVKIRSLQSFILDEVAKAMGFPARGLGRRLTAWFLGTPAHRFSAMFAAADEACKQHGFARGAQVLLEGLQLKVRSRGAEHIPAEGPALIASNHPGGYDSISIASQLPREDVKVLAVGVNFLKRLEALRNSLILVSYAQGERFTAVTEMIGQLRSGHSMLHFGTGTHDPDPETQPGSLEQISGWYRTLEVLLRKVPQTRLCLTAVSGVVEPRFLRHPLTLLRKKPVDKRRLAEMLQIGSMLLSGKPPKQVVHVSFDQPTTLTELAGQRPGNAVMDDIKERQRVLMLNHLDWLKSMGLPACS